MEPKIRTVFKFSADEDVTANASFRTHADSMIDMIDCAVAFLGPDLDALEDEFKHLGKRHASYGVEKTFLPKMAEAVIHTMSEMLGSRFNDEDKKAWKQVFAFMIAKMSVDMAWKSRRNDYPSRKFLKSFSLRLLPLLLLWTDIIILKICKS